MTITIDLTHLVTADATRAAELAAAQAAARAHLTRHISALRTMIITDLPGQSMIYLAKETEARAWLTAEDPDLSGFPLLAAETGITAPDPDSLAQIWLNLADLWRGAAAQLEALRLTVSAAIDAAGTLEDVDTALTALEAGGS